MLRRKVAFSCFVVTTSVHTRHSVPKPFDAVCAVGFTTVGPHGYHTVTAFLRIMGRVWRGLPRCLRFYTGFKFEEARIRRMPPACMGIQCSVRGGFGEATPVRARWSGCGRFGSRGSCGHLARIAGVGRLASQWSPHRHQLVAVGRDSHHVGTHGITACKAHHIFPGVDRSPM